MSAIIGASFGAAGQRCMAISVAVLVGEAGGWAQDIARGASALNVSETPPPGWPEASRSLSRSLSYVCLSLALSLMCLSPVPVRVAGAQLLCATPQDVFACACVRPISSGATLHIFSVFMELLTLVKCKPGRCCFSVSRSLCFGASFCCCAPVIKF